MTPHYSGAVGAAWLLRGGVKAVANIRGGGEYGPSADLFLTTFRCMPTASAEGLDRVGGVASEAFR